MAPRDSRSVNRCGHGHVACKFPINVTVPWRLLDHSSYDATDAARAILSGVADGKLYIVWPRQYWLFWRLKRLSPLLFLNQTQKVAQAQFAE